jgi:cytochrome c
MRGLWRDAANASQVQALIFMNAVAKVRRSLVVPMSAVLERARFELCHPRRGTPMNRLAGTVSFVVAIALMIAPAFAAGDPAKGEKVFAKCKACHTTEAGKNRVGPSLAGVFGRTAGTVDGFKYSDAMKGSGVVWNDETISQYLEAPKTFIAGNKMAFPGLKKPEDRDDVIAYLKQATGAQ